MEYDIYHRSVLPEVPLPKCVSRSTVTVLGERSKDAA